MTGPKKPARAQVQAPAWLADIGQVRSAALVFGAVLVAALAVVGTGHWLLQNEAASAAQAEALRDAARQRIFTVQEQKRDVELYSERYAALRARGLTGAERRLEWIEAIKEIQAARQLLPITYEFAPQQPMQVAGGIDLGDYRLHGSKMTMHMELLHEMDLLNFLSDLRQRGFFTTQQCALKRNGMSVNNASASGLVADCTLTWFSLDKADAAAVAAGGAANAPGVAKGMP